MPKTVYELKSKEELGEKINIYYDELLKADLQLMEEDVVNSIIKKTEYPDDDYDYPTLQTAEKNDGDRIKEEIEYLKTGLQVRSRDFETIKNIEDEK